LDFTHLYTTLPEKSVDEDLAVIQETFRDLIKKGKTNVKLINYYHGLPLSFPATMISIDHGMLDLDVHAQQAVAIERDRYTFIRCDAFKWIICANIQYVNAQKRAATLTGFKYIEIMAERRNAIRLRLNPPSEAIFGCNGTSVQGKLYDLSMNGLAITTVTAPECEVGQETRIQFMLPNILQNSCTNVEVPATLVGVNDDDKTYLCKFSITVDKSLEQLISKYIFQRQVEIIQDLRDASF
jgi:c-di-GMP-binding flagellar brake protein YcgR